MSFCISAAPFLLLRVACSTTRNRVEAWLIRYPFLRWEISMDFLSRGSTATILLVTLYLPDKDSATVAWGRI